jgi:thiamine biosynthesis lipoprotein
MIFIERLIEKEIMATDIYVGVVSITSSVDEVTADIDLAFDSFRKFEARFSRFLPANELSGFNSSGGSFHVSEELFDMLELAQVYYLKTQGFFNVCILPSLLNQGYEVSQKEGYYTYKEHQKSDGPKTLFTPDQIYLDRSHMQATKPKSLTIDLGGIGKSYIVKKVAEVLARKYRNFIVNAGGDMVVSGTNIEAGYDYWAVDIEHPTIPDESVAILMVKDVGVATSGVNKRHWLKDGKPKNHIINPQTGESLETDLYSATVITPDVIDADIHAKYILATGAKAGVASFLIDNRLNCHISREMERYVWKS